MSGESGARADVTSTTGGALRTFLIADVRGYTRYTQEHGDEDGARLAARFAELARNGIEQHGGELLELRGDEALGIFGSARDALRSAVALQRLFRERVDGEPGLPLGVGIGLDAGEAVAVEGGYRGGALNLAARLCSRAAPGEILASETVASLARRVEGIRFHERGVERFKGLDEPVKVIEVVPETGLPPVPRARWARFRRLRRKHLTGPRLGAAAFFLLLAAGGAALAVVVLGEPPVRDADSGARVALIASRAPADDPLAAQYSQGLFRAARDFGLETETILIDDVNPTRRGSTACGRS